MLINSNEKSAIFRKLSQHSFKMPFLRFKCYQTLRLHEKISKKNLKSFTIISVKVVIVAVPKTYLCVREFKTVERAVGIKTTGRFHSCIQLHFFTALEASPAAAYTW